MSTLAFCYLAHPEKGLATLEHEGQRFVPLFARAEDLQRVNDQSAEQLASYRIYIVSKPDDTAAFLETLRGLSLQVGIAGGPSDDGSGGATFAVMAPDALARALTQEGRPQPSK